MDVIICTCKKHLIKSSMQDCYLNLSHMELERNYYDGLKIFYQIEGNVCIDLHGSKSDRINIFSGVPRERVLDPLLFIVYYNNQPYAISSNLYTFTDETKFFHTITFDSDCNILQQDLNNVMDWETTYVADLF